MQGVCITVVQSVDGLAGGVGSNGRGVSRVEKREVGVQHVECCGRRVCEACGAVKFAVAGTLLVSQEKCTLRMEKLNRT